MERGEMEMHRPTRPPESHEWMPDDYFRRQERAAIFPGDRPLEVDLGCGDGTFLLEMAAHYPDRDFLGVERLLGRARKVCRLAAKRNLPNVKVLRLDSLYTVEWLLRPGAVSRLHLLYPDPWPKVKHHRRSLFQTKFHQAVSDVCVPGSEPPF